MSEGFKNFSDQTDPARSFISSSSPWGSIYSATYPNYALYGHGQLDYTQQVVEMPGKNYSARSYYGYNKPLLYNSRLNMGEGNIQGSKRRAHHYPKRHDNLPPQPLYPPPLPPPKMQPKYCVNSCSAESCSLMRNPRICSYETCSVGRGGSELCSLSQRPDICSLERGSDRHYSVKYNASWPLERKPDICSLPRDIGIRGRQEPLVSKNGNKLRVDETTYFSGFISAGNSPRLNRSIPQSCCSSSSVASPLKPACTCQPQPVSCKACEIQMAKSNKTFSDRKTWPERSSPNNFSSRSYSFEGKKARNMLQEDEGALSDTYLAVNLRSRLTKLPYESESHLENKYFNDITNYLNNANLGHSFVFLRTNNNNIKEKAYKTSPSIGVSSDSQLINTDYSQISNNMVPIVKVSSPKNFSHIKNKTYNYHFSQDQYKKITPPSSPMLENQSKFRASNYYSSSTSASYGRATPPTSPSYYKESKSNISPPIKRPPKSPELPEKSSRFFQSVRSTSKAKFQDNSRRASDSKVHLSETDYNLHVRFRTTTSPVPDQKESKEEGEDNEEDANEEEDCYPDPNYLGCQYVDPLSGYESGPEVASGLDDPPSDSPARKRKVNNDLLFCKELIFPITKIYCFS